MLTVSESSDQDDGRAEPDPGNANSRTSGDHEHHIGRPNLSNAIVTRANPRPRREPCTQTSA